VKLKNPANHPRIALEQKNPFTHIYEIPGDIILEPLPLSTENSWRVVMRIDDGISVWPPINIHSLELVD
jgi:hypothetical protein